MFKIAKSKCQNQKVAKSCNQKKIRPKIQFRSLSTCSLTIICYFVCSAPHLVYSALRLTSAGHMTPRISGCKNMLISVVSVSVCINNISEK